jgi:hypothetical protein
VRLLTAIRQRDHWRVQMKWPHRPLRYFGNFDSKRDAEKWIEAHHWLTTQRREDAEAAA